MDFTPLFRRDSFLLEADDDQQPAGDNTGGETQAPAEGEGGGDQAADTGNDNAGGGDDLDINIDDSVSTILPKCNYDFEIREAMISDARHYTNPSKMVENGLKVILSMYNRFANRDDFGEESALLTKGNETSSISFDELIKVDNNSSVRFVQSCYFIQQEIPLDFLLNKKRSAKDATGAQMNFAS